MPTLKLAKKVTKNLKIYIMYIKLEKLSQINFDHFWFKNFHIYKSKQAFIIIINFKDI